MSERTRTASVDVVGLMREALLAFYRNAGFAGADQMISRATDAEIVEAYEVMYEELK